MTWRPDYEIKSFYPDGQKHSRAMALHTWHVGDVSRDLEIDAYRSRMARGEIGRIEVKDCRTGQVQHIYPSGYIQCPKCGALSGDAWSQCGGSCPMTASPYYNESAEHAFTAADGEDVAPT